MIKIKERLKIIAYSAGGTFAIILAVNRFMHWEDEGYKGIISVIVAIYFIGSAFNVGGKR